ncbi:GFA family protein [Lentisphaera marina]|uniref:GFA family protein n=1 Tax=Lentisphaera marina TaxID=1111041 RepID=UPI0023665453|nr:GFA family protein [Lentisphaera marina]MDD7986764.1 GFA family protein [Lentisphaera marina]
MSSRIEAEGQCLCGAVKAKVKAMSKEVGVCHCDMCRKWAGAPFIGVDCQNDILFEGQEYIKIYHSSDWAERGFCSKCGTHLFYHLKAQDQYIVPVGLFCYASVEIGHITFFLS